MNCKKDCEPDKVCNKLSGRCVKKTGRIGKTILTGSKSSRKSRVTRSKSKSRVTRSSRKMGKKIRITYKFS